MSIYITGSVAYDRIMNFSGKFTDSILPDQIHNLNVSFLVEDLDEKLGGNAGNIAHTLALLGEKPIVVGSVGKDFSNYAEVLKGHGLSTEGLTYVDDALTASAYIMTDKSNNQITAFHAAAMLTKSSYDFPNINAETDFALICPANPDNMKEHPVFFKEKGIRYIFDPAQQLPMFDGPQLLSCIEGAYLLVGNDYEIKLIMNMTGKSKEELIFLTQRGIITTLGAEGSLVSEKDKDEIQVPAVSVTKVLDPTGAGDAYRAGLLKGLVLKQPLEEAARLGSTCAAFCIENKGTQEHFFGIEDFFKRHSSAFGTAV